ncbi:response regulator receiver-modulated CheB methylesterase [Breoghania corrubedonensis]|uniref:Protein-glutamate methylesterase/protein-glutamine glutaminase n=1 Tax=Breoghania corrubedonensis TaxID=665038 RepID=A0A2T5UU56_9HYPH|nr:chemotaxis response regulator protein-glutamate methylesterase [Breoghania corrubedonensis]PTW55059.1 response regulator receiver-modulated CheB methylesterase [Breoghania corrubedonensis]
MPHKPVRVLIVDDSALIRQLLTRMLSGDPDIEVVGSASDPYAARDKIKQLLPDVITLDIEMPRMDGLEFLHKIMTLRPMPVVMVSSLTQAGADTTLQALEMGAIDFVAKPTVDLQFGLLEKQVEICAKVKTAASANLRREPMRTAAEPRNSGYSSTEKIVAIGASTGGVEALRTVLSALPADSPAILITQHMPVHFTSTFAKRLDGLCNIAVEEAREGTRVLPGHAYIAPGDLHLRLTRSGANYVCNVNGDDRVSGHCPSVDVLFRSVATAAGRNALGVILTGMGKDGALGLLEMRKAGSTTFGQDAASCIVYGMPRAAMECGAVETQLPLDQIAQNILDACSPTALRTTRI